MRFNAWTAARSVALLDGANTVFDVDSQTRWSQHWFDVFHCGIVVDAPSRQQVDLLGRCVECLEHLEWDGTIEGAKARLSGLRAFLASDPVGRECSNTAGVSIGGVCTCSANLLAFRIGLFRVLVDGRVALWEDSELRATPEGAQMPASVRRIYAQTPSRTVLSPLEENDYLVLSSADARKVVDVMHAADMESSQLSNPRIHIKGAWL
jgi:hypothetical protein